jgi:zinc protease
MTGATCLRIRTRSGGISTTVCGMSSCHTVSLPDGQSAGRASLRLRIDAGSLHEREDQSGVADFLEHMAFNGTRSLPGEQMVSFFCQRPGMSFGAHTNAATGFTETIYRLEVPNTDRVVMGETLHWFRDILDGLTIDEQEVKRERGVILSEATARNSGQCRMTTDSSVPLARSLR